MREQRGRGHTLCRWSNVVCMDQSLFHTLILVQPHWFKKAAAECFQLSKTAWLEVTLCSEHVVVAVACSDHMCHNVLATQGLFAIHCSCRTSRSQQARQAVSARGLGAYSASTAQRAWHHPRLPCSEEGGPLAAGESASLAEWLRCNTACDRVVIVDVMARMPCMHVCAYARAARAQAPSGHCVNACTLPRLSVFVC